MTSDRIDPTARACKRSAAVEYAGKIASYVESGFSRIGGIRLKADVDVW